MRHSCIKITFLTALTAIISALVPSCKGPDGEAPETGCWYTAKFEGKQYFVNFESFSASDGTARGVYYVPVSDTSAARHDFSAEFGRRRLTLETDGVSRRMKLSQLPYSKYAAPEFTMADTSMFRNPFCKVKVTENICYAKVRGYWTSLPGVEAEVSKAFTQGYVKSFRHKDLDLKMDVYQPEGLEGKRPLILFMHGGAFYVGDKKEPAYVDFCRHFASMGYITASINYRMGFHLGKGEIERAGYVALQDAHAAMRFLVSRADEYGIDTEQLFVAGSSAGSITALNLAFMTEKDRPESSHGGKGLFNGNDLGPIDGSGNDIKAKFHIKAIANMWGAVSNPDIIHNSKTDIVSFHGDADNVVPYAEGYPFSSAGEAISQLLSEKMYGSVCIDSTARACGLKSRMYSFAGEGHALNTTGKEKTPNANHSLIKLKIADFFFNEIMPVQARIIWEAPGKYTVNGKVESASWDVEGGFVLAHDRKGVQVLWMEDAPIHRLTVSGTYPNGLGYCKSKGL